MTDEEFDTAVRGYMSAYELQTGHTGAIYIVPADQGASGTIITDPTFIAEFRTRMDGNQTPVEGSVVAVLG